MRPMSSWISASLAYRVRIQICAGPVTADAEMNVLGHFAFLKAAVLSASILRTSAMAPGFGTILVILRIGDGSMTPDARTEPATPRAASERRKTWRCRTQK